MLSLAVKSRFCLFWMVLACISAPKAEAGGGYGSVWATNSTPDSITINWSTPSGRLRACGSSPQHVVCYKEAGSARDTCRNFKQKTGSRPYTFSALPKAKERYKIKVYTMAEKKSFGKFRNCKLRKVGTAKLETAPTPPVGPGDVSAGISVIEAGDGRLRVRVRHSQPQVLSSINTCYKMKWWPESLDAVCRDPAFDQKVGKKMGYQQNTSPSADFVLDFDDLARCRSYKIIAYAFSPSLGTIKIGQVEAKTLKGGKACGLFKKEPTGYLGSLLDDHEHIAYEYLESVNALYGGEGGSCGGPLLFHLVRNYPALATAVETMEGGEVLELFREANLLDYLRFERPKDLEDWQREPRLRRAGLGVTHWLEKRHPKIFREATEELGGDRADVCSWTSWLNRDRPSGKGDFETLRDFLKNGQACAAPKNVECRPRRGKPVQGRKDPNLRCEPQLGAVCTNPPRGGTQCADYEVRFLCCQPRP